MQFKQDPLRSAKLNTIPPRWLRYIPAGMVTLRFLLGPLIWGSVWLGAPRLWFLAGFFTAFISDIYDGILARRWNVSTAGLRLADGWVDTWFYGWVAASVWLAQQATLIAFAGPISLLLILQVSEWIFSWFKFGRPTSYHAYSAKLFGIALFVSILSMMGLNLAGWVLWSALILGCLNSAENWLISLILPTWMTDVPSVLHAWRLRQKLSSKPAQ